MCQKSDLRPGKSTNSPDPVSVCREVTEMTSDTATNVWEYATQYLPNESCAVYGGGTWSIPSRTQIENVRDPGTEEKICTSDGVSDRTRENTVWQENTV
jgi:hypothetical protein